jgi:hypothetical protein
MIQWPSQVCFSAVKGKALKIHQLLAFKEKLIVELRKLKIHV